MPLPPEKRSRKKNPKSKETETSSEDEEKQVQESKAKKARKNQTPDETSAADQNEHQESSGNGDPRETSATRRIPTSEGELVWWLSTPSVPLSDKITAATAAIGAASSATTAVSGRLASAILQFAANAVLRSCPSSAFASLKSAAAVTSESSGRTPDYLNPALWSLCQGALLASPYSLAGVIGSIGPHICRPIHACLAHAFHAEAQQARADAALAEEHTSVSKRAKGTSHAAHPNGAMEARMHSSNGGGGTGLPKPVSEVLSTLWLLRSKHHDAFRPPAASLTNLLGHLLQLYAAQLKRGSHVLWSKNVVLEVIACTQTHVAAAPSARKAFALVVDELAAPAAVLNETVSNASGVLADAGEDVRVRLEALLTTALFGANTLAEFGMSFSFRREDEGAQVEEEGSEEKKSRGKKGVYRGNKIRSYQTALFDKLRVLSAEGCEVEEGRLDASAAVRWFPRVLRLFLQAADAAEREQDLPSNKQESSEGAGGGKKRKGGGGGAGALGMDFLRELVHILDASANVSTADTSSKGKPNKDRKRKAEAREENEDDAAALSWRAVQLAVHHELLELIVEFDIYRVHTQGEAGEAKEFLRTRADYMALQVLGNEDSGAQADGDLPAGCSVRVEALVLDGARTLLSLDHSIVEQHAIALLGAAMRGRRRRAGGGGDGEDGAEEASTRFVCALCSTYRKLNQMDRFMEWFLDAISTHPCPRVDASEDSCLAFLRRSLRSAGWGELPSLWEHALNATTTRLLPPVLRQRSAAEWDDGPLLAMLHVMQVVETLAMAAHALADGADAKALAELCCRTAQQAVAPLVGAAHKSLKSKERRQWGCSVLAGVLGVQAALSSLYAILPDAVKSEGFQGEQEPAGQLFWLAGVDDDLLAILKLLTKSASDDSSSKKTAAWCSLTPAALVGGVTRAACRSLQGCDRLLWRPLLAEEDNKVAAEKAAALARLLLEQYLAACRRVCLAAKGGKTAKKKAKDGEDGARLVVSVVGSQLSLVVQLAADQQSQGLVWEVLFAVVEEQAALAAGGGGKDTGLSSDVLRALRRHDFFEVQQVRDGMMPSLIARARTLVSALEQEEPTTDASWAETWLSWAGGALDAIAGALSQGGSGEHLCWSMKPKPRADTAPSRPRTAPGPADGSVHRLTGLLRAVRSMPPGYLSGATRSALMLALAASESAIVAGLSTGRVGLDAAQELVRASRTVLLGHCTGGSIAAGGVDPAEQARAGGCVLAGELGFTADAHAMEWLIGDPLAWAGGDAMGETELAVERIGQSLGSMLLGQGSDEGAAGALQALKKVLFKAVKDAGEKRRSAMTDGHSLLRVSAMVHGMVKAIAEEEERCRRSTAGAKGKGERMSREGLVERGIDATLQPADGLVAFLRELAALADGHVLLEEGGSLDAADGPTEGRAGLLGIVGSVLLAKALLRSKRCRSDAARSFAKEWGSLPRGGPLAQWALRDVATRGAGAPGVGNGSGLYLLGLSSAMGKLAPAVEDEVFREFVSQLVGAHGSVQGCESAGQGGGASDGELSVALGEDGGGWLGCCFRQLLSLATHEQLGAIGKALLHDLQESLRGSTVPWLRLHGALLLCRCTLQAVTPASRRWQSFVASMPHLLALLPAVSARVLCASQHATVGGGSVQGWWAPAAAALSAAAAAAVASLLRREEQIVLDPRAVQCGVEVAVSIVSTVVDDEWTSALKETGERGSASAFGGGMADWQGGGAALDKHAVREILEQDFMLRCRLMDCAYHVLHATVTRRPKEVPSVMPCILQCIDRYFKFLLRLSSEAQLLDRIKRGAAPSAGDGDSQHRLRRAMLEVARSLGRLLEALAGDTKRFNKYAVHVLLLYMHIAEHHPSAWPSAIKEALLPGIFAAIDACGQYELQQVHGLLSTGARPLFQSLCADFKRTYKYVGEA